MQNKEITPDDLIKLFIRYNDDKKSEIKNNYAAITVDNSGIDNSVKLDLFSFENTKNPLVASEGISLSDLILYIKSLWYGSWVNGFAMYSTSGIIDKPGILSRGDIIGELTSKPVNFKSYKVDESNEYCLENTIFAPGFNFLIDKSTRFIIDIPSDTKIIFCFDIQSIERVIETKRSTFKNVIESEFYNSKNEK